jgi:hypothetical protein
MPDDPRYCHHDGEPHRFVDGVCTRCGVHEAPPSPDYRAIAGEALALAEQVIIRKGCHCYDDCLDRLRARLDALKE